MGGLGGGYSLSASDSSSAANTTNAAQAAKASGNWSLINQQIATGQAQLVASQAASETTPAAWMPWALGGAAVLVLIWMLRRKA